jgi:hypothetical protein
MKTFIEQLIIAAIRLLLIEQVNKILNTLQFSIPQIEFSEHCGNSTIVPLFELTTCERTDKERILQIDTYSLIIRIVIPDAQETELHCYAYAAAIDKAIKKNPKLDGVANRVTISNKKYYPPKQRNCGGNWETVITLRITVEETAYVN